jgi:hypothetical protein
MMKIVLRDLPHSLQGRDLSSEPPELLFDTLEVVFKNDQRSPRNLGFWSPLRL